jgi:5-methylcytosine-specific restriction endonuclease McrA
MSDAILPEAKVCNTCGILKPLSEYHRNKKCQDGRLARCKACRKVADAPYVESYRERGRQNARAWRMKHPEESARKTREWAQANPGRMREYSAKYRRSERGRATAQRWLEVRDRSRRQATTRRYYLKNKTRYLTYASNRRARIRGSDGHHSKDDVAFIAQKQGMRCIYCRNKLKHFHIDHILPLALGGANDKTNIQLLCPRCNRRKGAKHPIDYANRLGLLL